MPAPNFPQIDEADKWDITIIQQGSTWMRSLTFSELDLTGFSFRGQIKRHHTERRALASFTITAVSSSELSIQLTPRESSKLVPGILAFDIEMYYAEAGEDLFVARILSGKVKVTPEITKR
jgi:hypothetical protein